MYELDSPAMAGNQNASPEYTQSMIEKALNNADHFAVAYTTFISKQSDVSAVEAIKTANGLATSISEVLLTTKGLTRLTANDEQSEKLTRNAKATGEATLQFFLNLQSYRLAAVEVQNRPSTITRLNAQCKEKLSGLSATIESLISKSSNLSKDSNIVDIVEREMSNAAKAIEAATQKLELLINQPKDMTRYSKLDLTVHDAILAASLAITKAIGGLIKAATDSQQEIVAQGKGTSSARASCRN